MGIFNLPAPVFEGLDRLMGVWLSPAARLGVWALLASIVSMALYRGCSRQAGIRAVQEEAHAARRALLGYDGDFAGFSMLARASLAAPLRWLVLVSGPALLASLPVVLVVVWLDGEYGYDFPSAGQTVEIRLDPPMVGGLWTGKDEAGAAGVRFIAWPSAGHSERLLDELGDTLLALPHAAPVPIIHKRRWWNTLVGNPAGYLGDGSAIDSVSLGLPRQDVLGFGPTWARSWEWPFFALLLLFSAIAKKLMRIH